MGRAVSLKNSHWSGQNKILCQKPAIRGQKERLYGPKLDRGKTRLKSHFWLVQSPS